MPKTITYRIKKDGTTTTDFSGFAGQECYDIGDEFDRILEREYGIKETSLKVIDKSEGQLDQRSKIKA